MTDFENGQEVTVERRKDKRVTYTAVLGFKELKGQKLPTAPAKLNASATNLSLGGICFRSDKRPQTEHVILYLPDGSRALARVVDVAQEVDSLKYINRCEVMRWLPEGVKTL